MGVSNEVVVKAFLWLCREVRSGKWSVGSIEKDMAKFEDVMEREGVNGKKILAFLNLLPKLDDEKAFSVGRNMIANSIRDAVFIAFLFVAGIGYETMLDVVENTNLKEGEYLEEMNNLKKFRDLRDGLCIAYGVELVAK